MFCLWKHKFFGHSFWAEPPCRTDCSWNSWKNNGRTLLSSHWSSFEPECIYNKDGDFFFRCKLSFNFLVYDSSPLPNATVVGWGRWFCSLSPWGQLYIHGTCHWARLFLRMNKSSRYDTDINWINVHNSSSIRRGFFLPNTYFYRLIRRTFCID